MGPTELPKRRSLGARRPIAASCCSIPRSARASSAICERFPRVAVVIGWDDEVTLQCEGNADVVVGEWRDRCLRANVQQYPEGRQRAQDPQIVLVRIRPDRGRLSDYRPDTFGAEDLDLSH